MEGRRRASSRSTTTTRSSAPAPALGRSLLNSAAIAIPATIIPIAIAAFAAYGFAWIDFKGRKGLFIATVSLLAIPLQVALIPRCRCSTTAPSYTLPLLDKTITLIPDFDLAGTTTAVWLTHTGFAMPFAIFLLHNYISSLPKDLFEAARIDGADHFTIFWRLVLPLSVPVLAAFAIFQFLWTWNDYLIANTMIGANAEPAADDDPDRQPGRRLRPQREHPARRRVRPGVRPARSCSSHSSGTSFEACSPAPSRADAGRLARSDRCVSSSMPDGNVVATRLISDDRSAVRSGISRSPTRSTSERRRRAFPVPSTGPRSG